MSKKNVKDTILVGDTPELEKVLNHLRNPQGVLGIFCSPTAADSWNIDCLGAIDEVPDFLLSNPQVVSVYCCVTQISVEQVQAIYRVCKIRGLKFCAVLPVVNELEARFVPMRIDGQILLASRLESLARFYNRLLKRSFDILISLIALLTVFPVIYLAKYIVVKRKKMGTALRIQKCIGPNGKLFPKLSFRTPKGGEDRGLDSLPQLLNVFAGQMSLVGPSARAVAEAGVNEEVRLERHYLKSGMVVPYTCDGETTASTLTSDIKYVERWTLWSDLSVLIRRILHL